MKVRNIAFFGVMASILSVAGAYAEGTTPTTIIATKAYVDNQVGDLDSSITADSGKVLKGVTITDGKLTAKSETTLATVATSGSYNDLSNKPSIPTSANFVTNGTNALDLSADTAKAPSVTAVKGIVTTTQRTVTSGTGAAVDNKVPSELAVATALAGKQDTISDLATIRSNASSGATAATTIGGYGNIVTHNTSEFATSTQGGKADTAVQTIKKNGTAVTKTNGVVDIAVPTKVSDLTNDSSFATTTQVSTAKSEAIAGAAGGAYDASGTYSNNTIGKALQGKQDTISDLATIRSGAAAGATALQSSNVVSTYSATGTAPINGTGVAAAIGGLDSSISATSGSVLTGITMTDGKVTSKTETALGTAATQNVTDTYSSTGTAPVSGKAVAAAIGGLDKSAMGTSGKPIVSVSQADGLVTATAGEIKNAGIASDAAIAYTKMAAPTATINGGTAACSTSAPCVLSYDGSSYSWTTFAY